MRGKHIRRKVIAAGLLLHFSVLFLNSLPWSRFVAALYPYYGWYPALTGQTQSWGMYQYPDHVSAEYELLARFEGGRVERPWGEGRDMSSRQAYLLESLFGRSDGDAFAQRFLNVIRARWDGEPRPNALVIRRTNTRINDFSQVPEKGALGERQAPQEIGREW